NVNLVYTYQSAKADLVNTITDTVSGIKQTFTYDNEDQLTDYVVSGGSRNGLKTSYSYDSNGNRISSTNNLAGTYNYSFTLTTNSNKLNSWEKNNTSVPFTLHATGEVNTLSDMLTGNFKYDGEGNKRREMGVPCTHPTTGATTCNMWFDYNHKNERVFSYADNISEGRQFVYDENSHLIGEYRNSDQAQIVEYIWLGDIPIAAEMANDRLIYILTDHRGSPIRGYDAVTKANVWSLDTGPFGESAATVSVSGVEINLRFPGMYYDKQTGLYYNHHRYYNPKWGRYMEPDPIGLEGGLNPFVYSNNDPINKVDPSGLGWKKLKLIGSLFDDILAPLGREAVKRLSQNSSKEAAKQTTSNQAKNAATSNQAKSTAAKEGDANIVHVQNKSIEKGIRSLEKRIVEHENKLNDFKSNPTVRPGMEGQPVSVIKAAQEARIRHLEKEIQTFKENIKKLQESK
ncbi:MAG: RHS repeat-associated core domain-containing protein, partial [Acinetobacter baumannii]|nr:RHS repeat-associated core domain-containing protein [Acinetobacter baumannii]